jgi:hypothetical protein
MLRNEASVLKAAGLFADRFFAITQNDNKIYYS